MAISFKDVVIALGGKPLPGWSFTDETGFWKEEKPMLSNTKQPNPMTIKLGPHMFDETCDCESCAGYRAKRDAGMHIDIETVKREAELCKEASHDHWMRGTYRNEITDPIMSIPCSVVLGLCERSDKKPAQGHTRKGHGVNYWFDKSERLQVILDAREKDINRLTRERSALNNGLPVQPRRAFDQHPVKVEIELSNPTGVADVIKDRMGQRVATKGRIIKCKGCGLEYAVHSGDLVGEPVVDRCGYCLAA